MSLFLSAEPLQISADLHSRIRQMHAEETIKSLIRQNSHAYVESKAHVFVYPCSELQGYACIAVALVMSVFG